MFAGVHIRTGNNVSHSNRRTRRTFQPNTHNKSFYSPILQKKLHIEVTTTALRTIDKYGGLDNYILNTKLRHFKQQTYALSLRQQLIEAQNKLQSNTDNPTNNTAQTQVKP